MTTTAAITCQPRGHGRAPGSSSQCFVTSSAHTNLTNGMADSERERLSELVHGLNDVELAVLLSLVAGRHCILTTDADYLPRLQHEVELIGAQAFGLSTATVQCSPELGLDEFVGALLVEEDKRTPPSPVISSQEPTGSHQFFRRPLTSDAADPFRSGKKWIPNIVIVRDLDRACLQIQAQVLELMRTQRIVTRKSVLETPEQFLVIALLAKTNTRPALFNHLRETFFISHHHTPPEHDQLEAGDYEDSPDREQSDADSFASVVIRKYPPPSALPPLSKDTYMPGHTTIPHVVIDAMRMFAADVSMSTEIRRYLHDVVVFLRMHRAVKGGVTAQATGDFELLVKCLAPLHNLDFVTPALVSLAAFKVYNHRLELAQKAEDERSILWGSSPAAVEAYLKQVDTEAVIEDVLSNVKAPL
ncbi:hypothetical protein FN846DRAFT_938687 [Sphaerosporella brunnea]|uniref:Magnesium chelatase n=1 Tax=Sphaerosporella brunnea TaxID=1250544 RepID=A0A5J5F412_9PEZI|nr:hypothetical protein FN846DRAFT_938687 [Sphaerosporella brunnea]